MMVINSFGGKAGGVGAAAASGAYRWSGDAVPLKRRRVGLSNGKSVSDGGSFDDQVEEDVETADCVSGYEEENNEGIALSEEDGVGPLEDEDEDNDLVEDVEEANYDEDYEENEDNEPVLMTDRGGSRSSRGEEQEREAEYVGFDYHEAGTEDDAFDEDTGVAASPIVSGEDPEIERDSRIASGGDLESERGFCSPDEIHQIYDIDEEAAVAMSRGMMGRRQVSASGSHSELEVIPEKPPKGMRKAVKSKAEAPSLHGDEPKPRKEKAPRKKSNANGTQERSRFNVDNKARVTLERAREILAAVKASMMKGPKQCSSRHIEAHVVHNLSSSEDERAAIHVPTRVIQHQMMCESKISKKRSRAPKGDTEPTPRRRKPNVEIDDHHAEEKVLHRNSKAGLAHNNAVKLGHYSTSSVEVTRDGRDFGDEDGYEKKEYLQLQKKVVEKKVRKRRKPKDTENGPAPSVGLCPGSVLRDENWEPPLSPFGLIQETLYKDPWKVLLSCMLLNKTAGRQMHKVIWDLFTLCPDARTAVTMDTEKIAEKVYSLGLQNKRAKMIQRFSNEYLRGDWTNVSQLHGIGKYAADAYAIFCQGLWREVEPDDVQLVKYWRWLWETNGMGSAFAPEDS